MRRRLLSCNSGGSPFSLYQEDHNNTMKAEDAQLQCVGSLQVQQQKQLGFICGSLPVPTDAITLTEAAVVPVISLHSQRAIAPPYRMLPTQTDLKASDDLETNRILPVTTAHVQGGLQDLCNAWGNSSLTHPLAKKCEALAISGLAGYGDELDVVAPVDILKQIFRIPYSKARLSVAVHRVGRTLILNTGPDMEEGEKLVGRKKNQAKAMDRSLFYKFAMQSIRVEACDCPLTTSSNGLNSAEDSFSVPRNEHDSGRYGVVPESDKTRHDDDADSSDDPWPRGFFKASKSNVSLSPPSPPRGSSLVSEIASLEKSSFVGEHLKDSNHVQNESESHKRGNTEGFLRVLLWQLEELRMLIGSDLLLFSNDKHVAMSLHLWDIDRQVTPLMWLDVWLDNVMASVPELAICYHHNGVIQGYELLKTDDIFLLKSISEEGTAFFHPHLVQQNALSVLRFLQENCKEDPGSYWLFKNAGEDLIRLFDLSVISKNRSSCSPVDGENGDSLPSTRGRRNGNYSLPLGLLLYRLGHRLSVSQDPEDRCRCAKFFKKCLEFLGEHEHLLVQASAHEHVARLFLRCHKELAQMLAPLLLDFLGHANAPPVDPSNTEVEACLLPSRDVKEYTETNCLQGDDKGSKGSDPLSVVLKEMLLEDVVELSPESEIISNEKDIGSAFLPLEGKSCLKYPLHSSIEQSSETDKSSADSCHSSNTPPATPVEVLNPVERNVDAVSARLAAVHHVSQAIKSLRWQRQLQDVEDKDLLSENSKDVQLVPVCVYGEIDCIEICAIRQCELGPFMDKKLWQLMLLLGESYLAVAQAYMEDGQLQRALKATELACTVYGSMPYHLKNSKERFPSHTRDLHVTKMSDSLSLNVDKVVAASCGLPLWSMSSQQGLCHNRGGEDVTGHGISVFEQECIERGTFWGKAWTLVGDMYIEYRRVNAENSSSANVKTQPCDELRMTQDVVKEVKRLKKKLAHVKQHCTICSLTNCSCESDRVNSGRGASSSGSSGAIGYRKKGTKKSNRSGAIRMEEETLISDTPNVSISNVGNKSDENPKVEVLSGGDIRAAMEGKVQVESSKPQKDKRDKDIFSFLQRLMVSKDAEASFTMALKCYDSAICALWEGSQELELVLRKKGWVCNELGRRKLAYGDMKSAEAVLEQAIQAFRNVRDHTNVVLVHCNIGHGHRAAAEKVFSELEIRSNSSSDPGYKRMLKDAKLCYNEALKCYGAARKEMKHEESIPTELRNEVLTQYAHTYLRLGMLLMKEDRLEKGHAKVASEPHSMDKGKSVSKKTGITANDAVRAAISLYESLGHVRAQEAAYAQFQLACHHRDSCLTVLGTQGSDNSAEGASYQLAKRYSSLADQYWLKALTFYKAVSHPDMYLEILKERSTLCAAMAKACHSSALLELALVHLLEGRQVRIASTEDSNIVKPTDKAISSFSQQLQFLLRTMLTSALNSAKASSSKNRDSIKPEQGMGGKWDDVLKLKEMYRIALMSSDSPDLQGLYQTFCS